MDEMVRAPGLLDEEKLTDYDENGVDLTLIRWWQSLSALEKLEIRDQRDRDIAKIRELNDRH
jgi:hypothetical protein